MSASLSDYDAELGARLAEARKSAGLTQTDLGNRMDLTRSSIANIEAGRQRILVVTLMAFGEHLCIDPRWLLTGAQTAPGMAPARQFSKADRDRIRRSGRDLRAVADALDVLAGGAS